MIGNFDKACAVTLDYEGGNDDDPNDPGGRTSRGIIQSEWDTYRRSHSELTLPQDVWKAPQSAVVDIYRQQYWNSVCGDLWPTGCDLCVYDAGVNSGTGKALTWSRSTLNSGTGTFVLLAKATGALPDPQAFVHTYQAKRLAFLEALRTWQYFGRGWRTRVAGIESIAIKWILEAKGQTAPAVSATLQQKSTAAATKSKAAGGAVTVTPTIPAIHHTQVIHDSWLAYAVDITLVVATVAAVCWLFHYALNQTARAKAFAGAAK